MFAFNIEDEGINLYELLANCERVLETTVRSGYSNRFHRFAKRKKKHHLRFLGHPRFINQLSQGVDMISLIGEFITSSVNANMFTYEVAPVFNLMEETVLAHMRRFCGWSEDETTLKNGDGILAPGGAVSNLYAVLAARQYAFPEIKKTGIRNGLRPAMVISKHVIKFCVC